MPRPDKVQAVEEIKQRFSEASASFITEYRGLTVGQQQNLRNALRQAGGTYKVVKMTLTRLALNELGHNDLDEFLVGPTAIAFTGGDPVPVAKALKDFGADHEALIVKAGWMNGEVLAPEVVAKLAGIESRDVLLAKIVSAAKAPLTNSAGMLGSMTRDAASMFSQLLDQKEADAPPAPPEDTASEEVAAVATPEEQDEAPDEENPEASAPEDGDDAPAEDTEEHTAEESTEADADDDPEAEQGPAEQDEASEEE